MDEKSLLAKSITLLYRESQLDNKTENSSDLVRTVLEDIKISEISLGISSEKDLILALKENIIEMCNNPIEHEYEKSDLLQAFRISCSLDEKLYEAIEQGINEDIPDNQIKRVIVNIRKSINNHFKEKRITDLISQASSTLKFNRDKIRNINDFISELVINLEGLQVNTLSKDPAIMSEVDIGNDESLRGVFDRVVSSANGDRVYKTGWQALNNMLQGGFRGGEEWVVGGLQHKYKTGFNLSLFAQLAQFNTPKTKDKNKKPLILRISFEDSTESNVQFLYQYLKYDETREPVVIKNPTFEEREEMKKFVQDKLQVNGFHIKMLRVDPEQWTFKSLFNKIIELEAEGYAVEVLIVDYLSKMPTTGCTHNGVAGSDILNLFSRVRTFCESKNIVLITPHQLSTEAKQLLRGGIPEDQFVKEIESKGYFDKTRALDREFDGCLLIHLFKSQGDTYLSIQRDKHRISTIIDEKEKYMLLKFPKGMPIPSDLNGEMCSYKSLADAKQQGTDDIFSL